MAAPAAATATTGAAASCERGHAHDFGGGCATGQGRTLGDGEAAGRGQVDRRQLAGAGRRFDEDARAFGQSGPGGRLATGDFDRGGRGLGDAPGAHADLGPALRLLGVVRPDLFGVLLSHPRFLSSWAATRVAKAPRCGGRQAGPWTNGMVPRGGTS